MEFFNKILGRTDENTTFDSESNRSFKNSPIHENGGKLQVPEEDTENSLNVSGLARELSDKLILGTPRPDQSAKFNTNKWASPSRSANSSVLSTSGNFSPSSVVSSDTSFVTARDSLNSNVCNSPTSNEIETITVADETIDLSSDSADTLNLTLDESIIPKVESQSPARNESNKNVADDFEIVDIDCDKEDSKSKVADKLQETFEGKEPDETNDYIDSSVVSQDITYLSAEESISEEGTSRYASLENVYTTVIHNSQVDNYDISVVGLNDVTKVADHSLRTLSTTTFPDETINIDQYIQEISVVDPTNGTILKGRHTVEDLILETSQEGVDTESLNSSSRTLNESTALNSTTSSKSEGPNHVEEIEKHISKLNLNSEQSIEEIRASNLSKSSTDINESLKTDVSVVEKSNPIGVPVEESIPVSVPVEESIPARVPVEESIPVSVPVEESIPVSVPVEESNPISVPVEESIPVSVTVEESIPVSVLVEESIPVSVTVEESISTSVPVEESIPVSVPVEESIPARVPVEESIPVSVTVEDSIPVSATVESIPVSVPVEESIPVSVPVEESIPVSVPVEESIPVSVPVEESIPVSVPVEESIPVSVPVEESIPVSVPVEESIPVSVPVEESIPVSVPVEESIPVSVPVEESIPVSVPVEESIPVSVSVEESNPVSVALNEDNPESHTAKEIKTDGAVTQELDRVASVPENTETTVSTETGIIDAGPEPIHIVTEESPVSDDTNSILEDKINQDIVQTSEEQLSLAESNPSADNDQTFEKLSSEPDELKEAVDLQTSVESVKPSENQSEYQNLSVSENIKEANELQSDPSEIKQESLVAAEVEVPPNPVQSIVLSPDEEKRSCEEQVSSTTENQEVSLSVSEVSDIQNECSQSGVELVTTAAPNQNESFAESTNLEDTVPEKIPQKSDQESSSHDQIEENSNRIESSLDCQPKKLEEGPTEQVVPVEAEKSPLPSVEVDSGSNKVANAEPEIKSVSASESEVSKDSCPVSEGNSETAAVSKTVSVNENANLPFSSSTEENALIDAIEKSPTTDLTVVAEENVEKIETLPLEAEKVVAQKTPISVESNFTVTLDPEIPSPTKNQSDSIIHEGEKTQEIATRASEEEIVEVKAPKSDITQEHTEKQLVDQVCEVVDKSQAATQPIIPAIAAKEVEKTEQVINVGKVVESGEIINNSVDSSLDKSREQTQNITHRKKSPRQDTSIHNDSLGEFELIESQLSSDQAEEEKRISEIRAEVEAATEILDNVIPDSLMDDENLNKSEAGPNTAEISKEDFQSGDEWFKDPGSFDFLAQVSNKASISESELRKQSLYVQFDPFLKSPVRPKGPAKPAPAPQIMEEDSLQDSKLMGTSDLNESVNNMSIRSESNGEPEPKVTPPPTSGTSTEKDKLIESLKNENAQFQKMLNDYENTITQCVNQRESDKKLFEKYKKDLEKDKEEVQLHLRNSEIAFNDVHLKYERSKAIIEGMKANEDHLKARQAELEDELKKQVNKYETLKNHAISQLEKANQDLDLRMKTSEMEQAKLKAMLKKSEMHITSLQESLARKTQENAELTSICDDLISKVGPNA